jgi:hypothetical protein
MGKLGARAAIAIPGLGGRILWPPRAGDRDDLAVAR